MPNTASLTPADLSARGWQPIPAHDWATRLLGLEWRDPSSGWAHTEKDALRLEEIRDKRRAGYDFTEKVKR